MFLILATIGSVFLAALFLVLWLRERKHAKDAEIVAYGLRAQDDRDDNTKTSISAMESEYNDALSKLEQMGELRQDEWGRWIWDKTGKQLGADDLK
jgi:hypothetical protein